MIVAEQLANYSKSQQRKFTAPLSSRVDVNSPFGIFDPVEMAHYTPQAQYTKVDISGNGMQKGIGIASSLISNGKNMFDQIKGGALGSTSGKAGFAGQAIAMTSDIAGSFIPEKTEYSGPKGDITQTLDTVYDGIADAAMSMGPWGMMVGGIMKGGALLGKGMNAIGAGTDGMCVCAGTKVFTSTGKAINIEDLQKENGIIGWSEKTKEIRPLTIHDFIEPRLKECIEIVLKNGYSIRCSIDHPILSDTSPKAKSKYINGKRTAIRQWQFRRADELKVGDFVGLANNIDYWGNNHLDNAYLVGLLIGDGSYGKGSSCRIISADQDTWKYLEDNNLGIINHCDDSRPEKYNKEIRTYRIIEGMELMKQLGIAYLTGKEKTLPKNIGEFDKQSICNLIAGLFDTDGSISVNEDKKNYSITLYLSNRDLLEEVRILLHKLGIFSTINTRKPAKYELGGKIINSNESYRLEIHDISSVRLFYLFIPLNISYKKESLSRIFNMLKDSSPQEHNDISGAKQCKIISITPIGLQTVYNLLADNDHTYLANGIITHNTTTDAILGSSFFNLTPTGLINGIFGKKALTITKDTQAFDQIGSSYAGTNYAVDEAVKKSGKKYGLFSLGALKEANKEIAEAKAQQYNITNIANEARKRFDIQNSSMGVATNRRNMSLRGGYDLASVRVGKKGLKLNSIDRAKNILKKYKESQVNQFKKGGKLDPFEYYLSTLPENQKDSTNFRVKDYWIFNGKPKDFNEALKRGMFLSFDGIYYAKSIAENPETGEIEYMKSANHPTLYMESDWYEKGIIYDEDGNQIQLKPGVQGYEDWVDFRNNYKLVKSNPYWKYVKRISKHKNGGTIIEICNTTIIEPIDLSLIEEFKNGGSIFKPIDYTIIEPINLDELIEEFKNGGSINVIPDGALHARKHNMEIEGITKKGIPVVSENENGELEQQAEIEKEEIIYRIEVTLKLEELSKIYYNDNSTKELKDEAALEAGKLLTRETLYNTVDNTKKLL